MGGGCKALLLPVLALAFLLPWQGCSGAASRANNKKPLPSSTAVFPIHGKFTRLGQTQLRGNAIMITSTLTVVLFSTVVFGLMTKPLVRLLISPNVTSDPSTPKPSSLLFLTMGRDPKLKLNLVNPISRVPVVFRCYCRNPQLKRQRGRICLVFNARESSSLIFKSTAAATMERN